MPDLEQLQQTLAQLEATLAEVKASIETIQNQDQDFAQLKEIALSDKWPVAANKNLICDPESEPDKIERGRGIVELMVEKDLEGKKFLDFGCGEGHCAVYAASRKPVISIGYDIKEDGGWEKHRLEHKLGKLVLSTKWDDVMKHAPYDIVIVYDVIDHLEGQQPLEAMKLINVILASGGNVYLRAHPFTSRHAMHNYHDLNRGYLHLVFSQEELKQLMPNPKYVEWHQAKVVTPLMTYKQLFDDSGFEIVNTRPVKDSVEPFFKTPSIAKRIINTVKLKDFPEFQMSMQFLDYCLSKKQQ